MKKSLLSIIAITNISFSVFSQKNDKNSNINSDSIKQVIVEKLNGFYLNYNFPEDYKQTLEANIADYEFNLAQTSKKLLANPTLRKHKIDSLDSNYGQWQGNQIIQIENASKLWDKLSQRHELNDQFKQNFIIYHFYIGLEDSDEQVKNKIKALSQSKELKQLAKTIAQNETNRVVSKCSALNKLDSVAINYGSKKLMSYLSKIVLSTLDSSTELKLIRDSDQYCDYTMEVVKKKQAEIQEKTKAKEDELFIDNVLKGGLSAEVGNTILKLIQQRSEDLNELKKSSKTTNSMSELFESTDQKTKTEIKQEFSEKLAKLITYKQFAQVFGSQFQENMQIKTIEKMSAIQDTYDLTKGQVDKVNEMVQTYYFNEELTSAYYAFNKTLKKQKLSALSFGLEKKYKELMEGFNLKIKEGKKIDKRTYQWE
ncbi:hypothetical protein M601_019205 [Cellulophaga baltica 4]|nr:hypothetical protein M601_019205 [Cellulophaga baltica 4]